MAMTGINYQGRNYTYPKRFAGGPAYSFTPQELLARIRPYFRRIGLTRLANITHLDRIGVPVVLSVRPNAGYLAVDSGKGLTPEVAEVSAAFETVERYHGELAELPIVRLPYCQLAAQGYSPIPVADLPIAKNAFFSPNQPESWAVGWDILNCIPVAVPASMVMLKRYQWQRADLGLFQSSSNGLASGSHFLEALLSGLLETVERDATTCWQFAIEHIPGMALPVLPTAAIGYPAVMTLLARLEAVDIKVLLFDCTLDTQVPVYTAYLYDKADPHVGIFKGYGADLDPEIALMRAITEAIQSRLVYIAGARDDMLQHMLTKSKKLDVSGAIGVIAEFNAGTQAHFPLSESGVSFEADIERICHKLRSVGIKQVIVFDLTQPDFDLAVVRVVVPGLEGYYGTRSVYAPGRRALDFARATAHLPAGAG